MRAYEYRGLAHIVFPFASIGENRQRESNQPPTDITNPRGDSRFLTCQGKRAESLSVFLVDYRPGSPGVEEGQSWWK